MVNIILILSGLFASDIVEYNPASSPVTNRVTRYQRSVDTIIYLNRSNIVINPEVPTNGLSATWKVTISGETTNIVELSAEDLTTIANDQTQQTILFKQTQERLARTNALVSLEAFDKEEMRLLRALAELMRNELNILRTNRTTNFLSVRTEAQMINAIKSAVTAQSEVAP